MGRVERGALTALVEYPRASTGWCAQRIYGTDHPTEAQLRSTRRAIARLVDRGLIEGRSPTPAGSALVGVPGGIATFVADPPWHYTNTAAWNAAADHYETMRTEDIAVLDVVPTRAAKDAHLYLWTTASHLEDALAVLTAWGFTYKTYLVWIKPRMGLGNYFRVSTELCLFGVRGSLGTQSRRTLNYFAAPRGRHSAKPPSFHELVMRASPGPYLEMFARCSRHDLGNACTCSRCRHGWETWGLEA